MKTNWELQNRYLSRKSSTGNGVFREKLKSKYQERSKLVHGIEREEKKKP